MPKVKKSAIQEVLGSSTDRARREKAEHVALYVHLVVHFGATVLTLATVVLYFCFYNLRLQGVIVAVTLYIILFLWVIKKYLLYKRTVRLMLWGHKLRDGLDFEQLKKEWKYAYLEGFVESGLVIAKEKPFKIHFSIGKLADEIKKLSEQSEGEEP